MKYVINVTLFSGLVFTLQDIIGRERFIMLINLR